MTEKDKVIVAIKGQHRPWHRHYAFGDVEITPCAWTVGCKSYWQGVNRDTGQTFAIGVRGAPAMYFRLPEDSRWWRTRLSAFGVPIERKRNKTYAFGVPIEVGKWYRTGDFAVMVTSTGEVLPHPVGFGRLLETVYHGMPDGTESLFLVPEGSPEASLTGGRYVLCRCRECGWWFQKTEMVNGYCRECSRTHICDVCGHVGSTNGVRGADGRLRRMCGECTAERAELLLFCASCGSYVERGTGLRGTSGGADVIFCSTCSVHRRVCEDCGEVLFNNETCRCRDPIAVESYHDGRRKGAYNRILSAVGEDVGEVPTLGVELEMGLGDVRRIHRSETALALFKAKTIHFEHDSSLNDVGGIEMITAPCSFRYHSEMFGWPELCLGLISAGWRSHDKCHGCCGFHIHIGRKVFRRPGVPENERYDRLDAFVNKAWKYFSRIGRRNFTEDENNSCTGAGHYAGFKPGLSGKDRYGYDRYRAVNFTNDETVELRFPKGTLNPETILGTLAMADYLPYFVDNFTEDSIAAAPIRVAKLFHEGLSADPVRGRFYKPMADRLLPPSIFNSTEFQGEE